MTETPHELIIYGKVVKFESEKIFRLVDGSATWSGNNLLSSFEGQQVCVLIRTSKAKKKVKK